MTAMGLLLVVERFFRRRGTIFLNFAGSAVGLVGFKDALSFRNVHFRQRLDAGIVPQTTPQAPRIYILPRIR